MYLGASTTVSTNGSTAQQPWLPAGGAFLVKASKIRFINSQNSGAFDFSLDGGITWHLRPMSAGLYSEDVEIIALPTDIRIRRNGGTDLATLSANLFF